MLTEEAVAGGYGVGDACFYATALARAGMDFISLSRGGKFDDAKQPKVGEAAYPYTGPSGYECMPSYYSDERGPFGRNLQPAAAVRAAVRSAGLATPIVVSGGIHSFEQAETALREGMLRHRRLRPPGAGRPGLVPQGPRRSRRRSAHCASTRTTARRSTSGTAKSRASCGTARVSTSPGVRLSSDGKRRLLAPDWQEESG